MRSPSAWLWWLGTSASTLRPLSSLSVYMISAPRNALCTTSAWVGASSSCTTSSGRSSTSARQPLPQASQPIWQACGMSPLRTPSSISICFGVQHLCRQEHALADEVGDEAVRRAVVEVVGRVPLLDAAFVQDPDLVGHREGLVLVVRDQHRGGAGGLDDVAQLRATGARAGRYRGWRRARRAAAAPGAARGARERDALLLAAGELVRILLQQLRDAGQRGEFAHAFFRRIFFFV